MKKLILASQSPRRSEILKNAGYFFVSSPVHVSEIPNINLNLDDQILDISCRKASACKLLHQGQGLDAVILAADTMVCLDHVALGKPENFKMAFEFLTHLSGRKHEVKTAIYLIDLASNREISAIETTVVQFKKLSKAQIQDYIKTGEPMDKAGAYAIQGLGSQFVENYVGEFNNVVGLPLQALEKLFKLEGWNFQKLQHE